MKMRKGFTLVELLIVIVIIGILASSMMLSSGSATAAAEASNIVSDLRSMKAATLMFYIDSMDALPDDLDLRYLTRYMDNPGKFTTDNGYIFAQSGTTATGLNWWVGFDLGRAKKTREVGDKLAARAKSVGVYRDQNTTDEYTGGVGTAWMIAR